MIKHIKDEVFGIMEFITSIFKDLCSFRNKLTVFMCVLTLICVYLFRHDTAVVITALGVLDSYLIYYLHNRKLKDTTSQKKTPKK